METKQELPSDTVAQPGPLGKCWRAFNRWRSQYFWIRLLFLLLFVAYVCREAFFPLTPRLCRMYSEAILASWEPRLVDALARSKRVSLARRLQVLLRRVADGNGDGLLNEEEENLLRNFALGPEELGKKSVDANLSRLVEACHRAGLLPKSYTLRVARREARFAAVAEVEELNRPAREEIDAILKAWAMPDYSQLETWKRGAILFFRWLEIPILTMGRSRTVVVWLLLCFFLSLTVTAHARRRNLAKGLVVGAALSLPLVPSITVWISQVLRPVRGVVYELYDWGYDLVRPDALAAWGLGLLLLAIIFATGYLKRAGLLKRVLVVVPLAAPALTCLFYLSLDRHFVLFGPAIGLPCLSMAFAGFAGRITSGGHSRRRLFSFGMVGLGLVLLAWTADRKLSGLRYYFDSFPNDALSAIRRPMWGFDSRCPLEAAEDWLAWVWAPRWSSRVALPLGVICLITGLATLLVIGRLQRARGRRRLTEVQSDDKLRGN